MPSDLGFFIQWKRNDRSRRKQDIPPPHHTVPGMHDYRDHQFSQELTPADTHGGLYSCVCVFFFFCPQKKIFSTVGCALSACWSLFPHQNHGMGRQPVASIRRAVTIFSSGRCHVLGPQIISQLTKISTLTIRNSLSPNFYCSIIPRVQATRGLGLTTTKTPMVQMEGQKWQRYGRLKRMKG